MGSWNMLFQHWRNIKILFVIALVCAVISACISIYNTIYDTGYQAASLKYEKALSDQKTEYINSKLKLESKIDVLENKTAEKINTVETVYKTIEKEVIKYVSKPVKNDCTADFVTEWVQLHNRAANPKKYVDSESTGTVNDTAAGDTGRTGS